MHFAPWLFFTILALTCFGVAGLFQKLSTDLVSAESALVWLIGGFLLLQPLVYSGRAVFQYSGRNIAFVLMAGLLNALGSWGAPGCDEERRQSFRRGPHDRGLSNGSLPHCSLPLSRTHHIHAGFWYCLPV